MHACCLLQLASVLWRVFHPFCCPLGSASTADQWPHDSCASPLLFEGQTILPPWPSPQFIHRMVKQLSGHVRKDAIAVSLTKVGL